MNPKVLTGSKSVLIPNTPDMPNVKQGEIYLDIGQKEMPIIVNNKKTTLGKIWKEYKSHKTSNKRKKELEEHLDLTVIRTPADSISGTRVLKFKGFTGEKGFGALTNHKDNVYLGGADKDIDSISIYHGLSKNLKDYYRNPKVKNEWDNIEAKAKDTQ